MMQRSTTLFFKPTRHNRNAATMIAVMALLPILFILAAMAVNLTYIQAVHSKTQMVTDAATRAAGSVYAETESKAAAIAEAQSIAAANSIESVTLSLDASDFEFGVSMRSGPNQPYTFTPAITGNAVRLTTRSYAAGSGTALKPVLPIYGNTSDIRPICVAAHTQMALDVVLIVDRSGSMNYSAIEDSMSGIPPATAPPGWNYAGPVPSNSRWLSLVNAVNVFCDELESTVKIEQAALCSYHTTTATHQLLSRDYQGIRDALDQLSQDFTGLNTNIGGGLLEGLAAIQDTSVNRPWAAKIIVLMSDGNHTEGTEPMDVMDEVIATGIPVYTVSFSDEADILLMQEIADLTGGTHYHADNAWQLNAAFREIARNLPSILTQ